jgi:hypothetical protein
VNDCFEEDPPNVSKGKMKNKGSTSDLLENLGQLKPCLVLLEVLGGLVGIKTPKELSELQPSPNP